MNINMTIGTLSGITHTITSTHLFFDLARLKSVYIGRTLSRMLLRHFAYARSRCMRMYSMLIAPLNRPASHEKSRAFLCKKRGGNDLWNSLLLLSAFFRPS